MRECRIWLGYRLRDARELQGWVITPMEEVKFLGLSQRELRDLEQSDPLSHFMICLRLREFALLRESDYGEWHRCQKLMLQRSPTYTPAYWIYFHHSEWSTSI